VAPRVAAEVLEARRLLSASVIGNVLVVTGTSSAEHIEVYSQPADNNNIYVDINFVSPTFGPFNPANITKTQINGLAGNDTVLAYPGLPASFGLPFPAEIYGGDGNDSIQLGTDHNDTAYGGAGNDTVVDPGAGNDLVYGDDGDDNLQGRDGNDTIYGGIGYDTVSGGDGTDLIYGGTGSGADSDSVTGYDSLSGDNDNDTIYGEGGGDSIYGGAGADSLLGGDWHDLIVGGTGADSMYGNEGDDSIDALEAGGAVSDLLDGGNGNDCGWWVENVDDDSNMEGNLN